MTFAREEPRGGGVLVGSEAMHNGIHESVISCGWVRGECAMISMSINFVASVAEFFRCGRVLWLRRCGHVSLILFSICIVGMFHGGDFWAFMFFGGDFLGVPKF